MNLKDFDLVGDLRVRHTALRSTLEHLQAGGSRGARISVKLEGVYISQRVDEEGGFRRPEVQRDEFRVGPIFEDDRMDAAVRSAVRSELFTRLAAVKRSLSDLGVEVDDEVSR